MGGSRSVGTTAPHSHSGTQGHTKPLLWHHFPHGQSWLPPHLGSGWQEEGREYQAYSMSKAPGQGLAHTTCSYPVGENSVTCLHLAARDAGGHSLPVRPVEREEWNLVHTQKKSMLCLSFPRPLMDLTTIPSACKLSVPVIFRSMITFIFLAPCLHSLNE